MVRKGLDDPQGWLDNSLNHSFVAVIFRIDLEGMGGLGTFEL